MARRVVMVTGAGRGIGAAVALLAAGRGCDLVLTYRSDAASAEATAQRCRDLGAHVLALRADVASEPAVLAAFAACDAEFGRLDGLVNNAGITGRVARLADSTLEEWQGVFATNVMGTYVCAREAVRRMSRAQGGQGGAIVNLSSVAARLGSPGEFVHYAASKGAVDSLTIGLAKEVAAEGIRVNAVCPGMIETEIHASAGDPGRLARIGPTVPMGRVGTPGEVAEAVLWLLSDAASYVTGSLLTVGGGR